MTKLNKKLILYIIGVLLIFNGGAMLISSLVSLIVNDGVIKEILIQDGEAIEFDQILVKIKS